MPPKVMWTTVRIGAFPHRAGRAGRPRHQRASRRDPGHASTPPRPTSGPAIHLARFGQLDVAISVEFAGAPSRTVRASPPAAAHRRPRRSPARPPPLWREHAIELSQLAGADWVIGSPGTSCHDVVMVACATAGFTPRAVHHTSDWASVAALVREGDSVALIPRLAQTLVPTGVVLVPLHGSTAARHVFAATRRGNQSAPTTQRALQHLTVAASRRSSSQSSKSRTTASASSRPGNVRTARPAAKAAPSRSPRATQVAAARPASCRSSSG